MVAAGREALEQDSGSKQRGSGVGIGMSGNLRPEQTPSDPWKRAARKVTQWALLFGLWVALSGVFHVEFLVIGAVAAAAAVGFSELLFRGTHEGKFAPAPPTLGWHVGATLRFFWYLPWLAYQIIMSNLHVVCLVLHPRMPIEPSLVEFDTTLGSEWAQVLLAQSITLTPGTVTVDASNGKFLIHCLSRQSRQGLEQGSIQRKIAAVFGDTAVERIKLYDIETPGQVPL